MTRPVRLLIGVAMLLALATPAGAEAADCSGSPSCPYPGVGVLGADPPTGHGVFRFPQGIAFSPGGGYVFVADQYSGVVQKFDRQGNWVSDIGWYADARQPGRLGTIGGLATDLAHHLYVLDSENDRIQVFASDTGHWLGAFGSVGTGDGRFQLGENTGSGGIAIHQPSATSAPVAFIADQLNHRIQKFTLSQASSADAGRPVLPAGTRQGDIVSVPDPDLTWGSFGDCSPHNCGQAGDRFSLHYPQGVAVNPRPDGAGRTLVYVADDDNHRVVVYTAAGEYVSELGTFGTGPGQFRFPYDVGVDGGNVLYVADNNNHRVLKFDGFTFSYLGLWGGFGPGPGKMEFPRALSALADDPHGGVYVADTANNRVQGFDPAGTPTASWGVAGRGPGYVTRPGGVAVDVAGAVYVADTWAHRVEKFAPDGSYLGQWGYVSARSGYAAPNTGNGQFQFPHGIGYDSVHDQVWVADTDNNRVQVFSSAGAWIATFGGLTAGTGAGQFARPVGIAVDGLGNVYVADAGNDRVQRRDVSTGGWSTVDLHGQTADSPRAVTIDGDIVYVAAASRVLRVTATSATEVAGPGAGFDRPGGLWVAGPYLYVSDTQNNRVVRQDQRTGTWASFGEEGNGPGSFLGPLGLATNSAGDVLYVADQWNNRVERFGPPVPRAGGGGAGAAATLPPAQGKLPAVSPFRLRVKVLSRNLRRRAVRLALRCTQRCRITVSGKLLVPGIRSRWPLPALSVTAQPDVTRRVRLRASSSVRKRLLGRRVGSGRALMRVTVLATNTAGKHITRSLKIRL